MEKLKIAVPYQASRRVISIKGIFVTEYYHIYNSGNKGEETTYVHEIDVCCYDKGAGCTNMLSNKHQSLAQWAVFRDDYRQNHGRPETS